MQRRLNFKTIYCVRVCRKEAQANEADSFWFSKFIIELIFLFNLNIIKVINSFLNFFVRDLVCTSD